MATEECILRWGAGVTGDAVGRIVEVATRGRVTAERRVVKRRKLEENVIAAWKGCLIKRRGVVKPVGCEAGGCVN